MWKRESTLQGCGVYQLSSCWVGWGWGWWFLSVVTSGPLTWADGWMLILFRDRKLWTLYWMKDKGYFNRLIFKCLSDTLAYLEGICKRKVDTHFILKNEVSNNEKRCKSSANTQLVLLGSVQCIQKCPASFAFTAPSYWPGEKIHSFFFLHSEKQFEKMVIWIYLK